MLLMYAFYRRHAPKNMAKKRDFDAETPTAPDGKSDPLAFKRDSFSDVLDLIRVRGNTVFNCAASPPFGIEFPAGRHWIHIVRSGKLTISVPEAGTILQAEQGDLVLMVHGHRHVVSDQGGRRAISLADMAKDDYDPSLLQLGSGEIRWLTGDFGLDSDLAKRLLSVLPPVIFVKGLKDRPFEWLELSCRFILDEALRPRAGAAAMISRLLDVIFMQLLRTWAANGEVGRGWLSGAIDPRLNAAMNAMHTYPGRAWTVVELAQTVNLSRSAFADRFQRVVGQSPLSYLSSWRLDRAAEMLRYGRASVADVAAAVGYTSEAAFSRVFKGRYGVSPTQWRRTELPAEG